MQDHIRNHKNKSSNTNFLQQILDISEFKKENKSSNVHVNLTFSMMPKISSCPNYSCKWKWNFPKHKQGEIAKFFLYFPENKRHTSSKQTNSKRGYRFLFQKYNFHSMNHTTKNPKLNFFHYYFHTNEEDKGFGAELNKWESSSPRPPEHTNSSKSHKHF